jgi:hypothetical protein
MGCLIAEHVDGTRWARHREAGILVADEWCREEPQSIDLWGFDSFGEEFWHSFLKRCQENGSLENALKIEWFFGCETGSMSRGDKSFREMSRDWTAEFLANQHE